MTNEGRLTAAGWQRLHQPCDLTMYRWSRDGIDWYTEDEALVVVLTTERDAAIARAERSEAELGECKRWIGDVMEAMDNEFMSIQMAPVFIGAMAEMQKEYVPEMQALRARAEAAEALAASRPEITPIAALSEKKLELGRERDRHDECGRALMRAHKERDAAIARAERAEAQRDSARRDANGAAHRGDMACARADAAEAQRDALQRHFDAAGPEHNLMSLFDLYEERAEAAEALAASRPEITPEDARDAWVAHGPGSREAYRRVYDALRAHAAKVSR